LTANDKKLYRRKSLNKLVLCHGGKNMKSVWREIELWLPWILFLVFWPLLALGCLYHCWCQRAHPWAVTWRFGLAATSVTGFYIAVTQRSLIVAGVAFAVHVVGCWYRFLFTQGFEGTRYLGSALGSLLREPRPKQKKAAVA
jgi:hypothetical protein